jgi:hypothetical protein
MVSLRKISPTRHSGTTSVHLFMLAKRSAGVTVVVVLRPSWSSPDLTGRKKDGYFAYCEHCQSGPPQLVASRLSLILIPDLYETLGVRNLDLSGVNFRTVRNPSLPLSEAIVRCRINVRPGASFLDGAKVQRGTEDMEPSTWNLEHGTYLIITNLFDSLLLSIVSAYTGRNAAFDKPGHSHFSSVIPHV